MIRLDQHIRFVVDGVPLVMRLNLLSQRNEWIIEPVYQEDTLPPAVRGFVSFCALRAEVGEKRLVVYLDFTSYAYPHLLSDGIAVRRNWDGKTFEGLLPVTQYMFAESLRWLAAALDIRCFRRWDGRKIRYEGITDDGALLNMSYSYDDFDEFDWDVHLMYDYHRLLIEDEKYDHSLMQAMCDIGWAVLDHCNNYGDEGLSDHEYWDDWDDDDLYGEDDSMVVSYVSCYD